MRGVAEFDTLRILEDGAGMGRRICAACCGSGFFDGILLLLIWSAVVDLGGEGPSLRVGMAEGGERREARPAESLRGSESLLLSVAISVMSWESGDLGFEAARDLVVGV